MATYKKACTKCGELIPGDAQFCPFCANSDPLVSRCARCRNPVEEGWKICSSCGLRLRTQCPQCGKDIPTAWKCIHCGSQVLVQCPNKKCNEVQLLTREGRCAKCGKAVK